MSEQKPTRRPRIKLYWRFIRRENFFLSYKGLLLLLSAVVVIWALYAALILLLVSGMDNRGMSGDMFGGITALFSGLAFAGLIFTLFVQKKELQFQREELSHLVEEQRQTKEHLKDQATHLKSQSDFIERQIFESSFFQMLTSFNTYKSNLQHRDSAGAQALINIAASVRAKSHAFMGERLSDNSVNAITYYEKNYGVLSDKLGPYFRVLYNLVKFIDRSNISDKQFYANLVRAQLGSTDLTLLLLNGASQYGREKMAPLMKTYNLLKHFDDFELFDHHAYTHHLNEHYCDWDFHKKHQIL